MYTQCPECSSVFEISPGHLGAAGGMVQCGVCNTTFNALRRLTEKPPETATPELDGTDAPLVSKGKTSTEVESEPQVQADMADEDASFDDHPADNNEAPQSRTIDDEPALAADEFNLSDDDDSTEDTGHNDDTVAIEDSATDELAETDQEATDPQEADAEQANSNNQNTAESELDVTSEEVEATDVEASDDGDHSDLGENEALVEAELDDSTTGEDGTSEIDDSDVDAAEEELNELLEDLGEDDESVSINPDDLFSTSQILDEWDIEEGEHDLEAILADETLLEEEESDTDSDTLDDDHDANESSSSEAEELEDLDELEDLEQFDQLEDLKDLEDLDELVEFDQEDLDDQKLIDVDQNDNDADDQYSGDKESDLDENDDDRDDGPVDDDENKDAESQDGDEHESPNDEQDMETDESDEEVERADSDDKNDEGDETDAPSDSDEENETDGVATDGEADAEVEEPVETKPDSSAVLTEGVNGQFDDDYNDAEDLKDLGHYLSPKKSLARRLGEGSIAVLLAALLAGQYVHHNRTELATHPEFGKHVRNAYSALGKDLRVNWKVTDYRVARHTIVPNDDNADMLMARATVVNNSGFERPLPLIRLQLQNRWGDSIYGRVFTPGEYLDGTAPNTLAGNGKLEVSLDLVHPAPDEEIGYSFDVCLDTPAGPDCGTPQVFTE